MADINFSKVDAAFQSLADSDEGQKALDQLSQALDAVGGATSDLNDEEQHYLLVHLVNQRDAGPATNDELFATTDTRTVSGFRILTAVPPAGELTRALQFAQP